MNFNPLYLLITSAYVASVLGGGMPYRQYNGTSPYNATAPYNTTLTVKPLQTEAPYKNSTGHVNSTSTHAGWNSTRGSTDLTY